MNRIRRLHRCAAYLTIWHPIVKRALALKLIKEGALTGTYPTAMPTSSASGRNWSATKRRTPAPSAPPLRAAPPAPLLSPAAAAGGRPILRGRLRGRHALRPVLRV